MNPYETLHEEAMACVRETGQTLRFYDTPWLYRPVWLRLLLLPVTLVLSLLAVEYELRPDQSMYLRRKYETRGGEGFYAWRSVSFSSALAFPGSFEALHGRIQAAYATHEERTHLLEKVQAAREAHVKKLEALRREREELLLVEEEIASLGRRLRPPAEAESLRGGAVLHEYRNASLALHGGWRRLRAYLVGMGDPDVDDLVSRVDDGLGRLQALAPAIEAEVCSDGGSR